MKVIINGSPSKEALNNCAKVLEEIVNKELNKKTDIKVA